MATSAESAAAGALGAFLSMAKHHQPEIEWDHSATKLMQVDSPISYGDKSYVPGELFSPSTNRARMFVVQRLAKLVFLAQTTKRAGEIIPLENLARPPASAEGLPVDIGSVQVFFPSYYSPSYNYGRGCTLKVPAFAPWPDIIEETGAEFKPDHWNQFIRCRVLNDTDLLRAFVPLPWPWPLSRENYQFFLNRPTLHKVGYVVEGISGFTFGNPEGALLAFNPQIPE